MKYIIICFLISFSISAQAQSTPTTRTAKGHSEMTHLQEAKARLQMIRDLLVNTSVANQEQKDEYETVINDAIETINNTSTEETQVITLYKEVIQYTGTGSSGDYSGGDDGGGCGS